MPETVLLTGAAGFIGSHLAEALLARGDRVDGIDNFDPFYPREMKLRNLGSASDHPRFRLLEVDVADAVALDAALGDARYDVVVHLAAKAGVRPSIRDPLAYERANVQGTLTLLELARRMGCRRFVFASSSSVYGDASAVPFREEDRATEPISPYAATKRSGELLCHTWNHLHGLGVAALRFFTVYGPRQRPDLAIRKFTSLLLRGERIPMYGDGSTERDYTWIDDILQGALAAVDWTAENPGAFEILNLGNHRTTGLRRLIELIGEAVGVEPEVERLPMQAGDVRRTYASVDKARRLLGYEPTTPPEVGIPRFVAWMREEMEREARTATSRG